MNQADKQTLTGKEFKCLDKGFVRLIDVMGDDSSIVQAARVSYGKGTKTAREDRGLIRYLMRNRHTSPFEMVEYKFHVKLPIFVARQWIRHRTANVNEYSGRYSEMPDDFYLPEIDQIRAQSGMNKQGREDKPMDKTIAESIAQEMSEKQSTLHQDYKNYLSLDLARELARINLPLSTYTEWYWKIDLHNLFHFLKLRLDKHAQYEIRVYAEIIADIVKETAPLAWEAFNDYTLNSISFSSPELRILSKMLSVQADVEYHSDEVLTGRESIEFKEKINRILTEFNTK